MAPVAFATVRAARVAPARCCQCAVTRSAPPAVLLAAAAAQTGVAAALAPPWEAFVGSVLAGFAAAATITAAPAVAGVTLEKPTLKKGFVTNDSAPASKPGMEISAQPLKDKVKKAADAVTGGGDAKPAKAEPQVDVAPSNFNTQALWPVGIVASGAGIYALSKADSGFNELLVNAVKDSGADGIGAEDLIKGAGGYQEAYYTDNTKTPGAIKAGTKVLKKKPKKK